MEAIDTYKKYRWIGIVLLVCAFVAIYSCVSISDTYADTTTTSVKVTCSTLNVRSGPGTSYTILGKLTLGTKVTVTGSKTVNSQKWYMFSYQTKTGYILSNYTTKLSTTTVYSPDRTGQALSSTVVRSGPSTSYSKLGTIASGTKVTLKALISKSTTTVNPKWYRIVYNGKTAYVVASSFKMLPTVLNYDPPKTAISTQSTYYRSGPGTSYSKLAPLTADTLVTISAKVTTYDASKYTKWFKTTYNGKTAYVVANYFIWMSDADPATFENYLTSQGFPESYKASLRGLHAAHPKWIFVAQQTGIDWSSALAKEQAISVSLLSASEPESWKSFDKGAYDFTNNAYVKFDGSWNAADAKVVSYYFDPRNFINEAGIYQFLDHHFNAASQNTSTIRAIADGSFLDTSGYASTIYQAGANAGVNPNVLTSMIRQEQGTSGTSQLISGTYPDYPHIYNFFNIGAYTADGMSAVERGLWWASLKGDYGRPWDTKLKSITGGALYYKERYLDYMQNTLYLKKFNVMNGAGSVATHQYMTHILAAANEATLLSKAYTSNSDYPLVFDIPVFEKMPSTPCVKPGKTGNNDNLLNSLRVIRADTEGQYTLKRSDGTTGFTRYTTGYSVIVPSTVTKIIVNGVAHNNVSYVSSSYVSLGSMDSSLPSGFKNTGTTTKTTKVTASSLSVRSGLGDTYTILGKYTSGTKLTVKGITYLNSKYWYTVSYNGTTGYIDSVGTNGITATKYYSDWMNGTTTANVNVRKAPSTSATIIDPLLTSGSSIQLYGYVTNPDGSKWYMMSYKGATVKGGDVVQLASGTNTIKLVVTSTSGQKRTYTVTVNR